MKNVGNSASDPQDFKVLWGHARLRAKSKEPSQYPVSCE